jgi:penicillin-binding protein 2
MDRKDADRQKAFTRRALVLGGAKLGLLGVLVGRMYYLQVLESDQYQMLAEENRINLRLLAPPRGRILDRFGVELAKNRQNYRVVLVPEQAEDLDATLAKLQPAVKLDEDALKKLQREIARQRKFHPVTVAENLSWEQFAGVNGDLPDLPGVHTEAGETRWYPYAEKFSHVLGYVAAPSEKDIENDPLKDPLLELPGFRVGRSGVERTRDLKLRGKAGASRVEVNAYGRVIRELTRREGQPGQDLVLSLDAELQKTIYERLGEESAAAVVMDCHTGELLAMVSTPAYDPNAFNTGISARLWKSLLNHPRHPLINKTIAGQYPPGSTFKMVVALAALESGICNAQHTAFCNGAVDMGSHTFHCWKWKHGGHGSVDMRQAIAQSCDVYFYDVARRIGPDRIAEMARRFGLGEPTGVELPGEQGGLVPDRNWKLATTGISWLPGETLNYGIGQGYLLTTPLQLGVMAARLASGLKVAPRLTRVIPGEKFAAPAPVGVSPANLKVVQEGMDMVVNGVTGTAKRARLEPPFSMAGKTGTAQVRRITRSERAAGLRKGDQKPWEERDHGLFVAYAPVEAPRYAAAVVLEHGLGGTYAALATKDILTDALRRDPLRRQPPPGGRGEPSTEA